jgi:L-malate glycosyltransferase
MDGRGRTREAISFNSSVSILSPGEIFGGVEAHVLTLCVGLRREGIAVLPILFHDRELAARLRQVGFEPVALNARHRYDPGTALQLAALVRRHGSGILHVHGYRAAITAAVAGSRLAAAIVKTEHGLPEAGGSTIARIKSRLNRSLDSRATRRLHAHVCYVTSDIMQRCNHSHVGLIRRVIHNGIDPLEREGRSRPADMDPRGFHVGIVGRLSAVKGIPLALRALVSDRMPGSVRLDIIGSGPQQEDLQRAAVALGLVDRVSFHGFQRNVADWLAHLDALLMPSFHEGLPYALLEAMSLGVPVIASRVGGLAEVLHHDATGLLVEPGDAEGIALAVARIAGSRELASRLGGAAAHDQRQNFNLARMIDDYLDVYAAAALGS